MTTVFVQGACRGSGYEVVRHVRGSGYEVVRGVAPSMSTIREALWLGVGWGIEDLGGKGRGRRSTCKKVLQTGSRIHTSVHAPHLLPPS